ncbi:MOSC domain-containing protein [Methylothermus subterraneus]
MSLVLSQIYLYPVKSLGGIQVQAWELDAFGLRLDRRWMVVTPEGRFMTQREFPQMAKIQPRIDACGSLRLRHPELGELEVPAADPTRPRQLVTVWQDAVAAIPVGAEADAWLSRAIGAPCRLVWFPDDGERQVDTRYARAGERTAFTDGFPLLLLSQSSLDDLNRRLARPVTVRCFRPNLVVEGALPYAEDGWREIAIGGKRMRVVKPCSRCAITTVDPETGKFSGKEPLATLATYRKRDQKIYFGQNLIHQDQGALRVGDRVEVR